MSEFLHPGDLILFQGDSITDSGRCVTADNLGNGYVAIISAWLRARYSDKAYRVLNLGVGGDRTVELLGRWKNDCLCVKPDVLSIMIGVNDVWRLRGEWNGQKFVSDDEFMANYRLLVEQAREAGISRFVLASPTTITEGADPELDRLLEERASFIRSLAKNIGAVYVPTREVQLRALKEAPELRWTMDGCHPTIAGHALLASAWLEAVGL